MLTCSAMGINGSACDDDWASNSIILHVATATADTCPTVLCGMNLLSIAAECMNLSAIDGDGSDLVGFGTTTYSGTVVLGSSRDVAAIDGDAGDASTLTSADTCSTKKNGIGTRRR